jgi:hypothetical protein
VCIDINTTSEGKLKGVYRSKVVMVHDNAKAHNPRREKRIQPPMLMVVLAGGPSDTVEVERNK